MKSSRKFYTFISPWLVGFFLFTLVPILISLYTALTRWNGTGFGEFIGLRNFRFMFSQDPLFYKSLLNTLYYSVGSVVLGVILALILAILLNQKFLGRPFYRSVFFLPYVVTGVPVFVIWTWLFNPQYGVFNYLLSLVGIPGSPWLNSQYWSMPSLIIMSLTGTGGMMVVFLAGLQGIPRELYESATIDGAGSFTQAIRITIPLIMPVVLFNTIWSLIGAMKIFAQPYVMTQGGPNYSTLTIGLYLYQMAFQSYRFGYASGLAWVLFAVTLGITLIILSTVGRRMYYEGA